MQSLEWYQASDGEDMVRPVVASEQTTSGTSASSSMPAVPFASGSPPRSSGGSLNRSGNGNGNGNGFTGGTEAFRSKPGSSSASVLEPKENRFFQQQGEDFFG